MLYASKSSILELGSLVCLTIFDVPETIFELCKQFGNPWWDVPETIFDVSFFVN